MESALSVLKSAGDFSKIEQAWTQFLSSFGRLYSKLELGAKSNARSAEWYRAVRATRKSDPLLQYLHQARNSHEHGLEDVTTQHAKQLKQPMRLPNGKTFELTIQITTPEVEFKPSTPDINSKYEGPQIVSAAVALVPVKNYNVIFSPPSTHLGAPFGAVGVVSTAEAGLAYAKSLITEAENLPS